MPDLREELQASLRGAYVIERELGGGGMSRTFLAHETSLGRKVVIKVLLPELAAGVSIDRFRREIQLTAQLQHPHIVPVHSTGTLPADEPELGGKAGLPYYTMPFVEGESLRVRLARDVELPVPETMRLLRDVASALAYAHERGIIHRDIKPDNVLLSHGVAVVTDFGVAKALTVSSHGKAGGHVTSVGGLTSMGLALGTPAYMAPEQASADPGMDHRVDVYAFGVMAYEMLAGLPPFHGRSPQALLAAHVTEAPEHIGRLRPAVPPALGTLVMRCLEKRPADRPQTAADLIHEIDNVVTPSGGVTPTLALPATRATPPERHARLQTLRRRAQGVLVAAGLAALGAAIYARLRPIDVPRLGAPASRDVGVLPAPSAGARDTATPPAAAGSSTAGATPRPAPARRESETRADTRADTRSHREAVTPSRERESHTARADTGAPGVGAAGAVTPSLASPAAPARETLAARDSAARRTDTAPTAAAPPPAAPKPAPAPPPPDPAPAIRAAVADYASAIEAGSVSALRRVYPNLSPQQQTDWEQFFQGVRELRASLGVTQLTVSGDSAEAQVAGQYLYQNTSTRRAERQPVSFRAMLRRGGEGWRITGIR